MLWCCLEIHFASIVVLTTTSKMPQVMKKVEVSRSLLFDVKLSHFAPTVTVYYKSEVSSKKVFDIGCSGVDQGSFGGFEKRLASIEDK